MATKELAWERCELAVPPGDGDGDGGEDEATTATASVGDAKELLSRLYPQVSGEGDCVRYGSQ